MSERAWLGIGIRLLGLYFLISGIANIPNIFLFIGMEGPATGVQIFALTWNVGLYIAIGCVFVFYGRVIAYLLGAQDAEKVNDGSVLFEQLVQLIGIFVLATSIPSVLKAVIPLFEVGLIMAYEVTSFIVPVSKLVISVFLILKPKLISSFVAKHR